MLFPSKKTVGENSNRICHPLQSLGFQKIIHRCRDFYQDIANNDIPKFHVPWRVRVVIMGLGEGVFETKTSETYSVHVGDEH